MNEKNYVVLEKVGFHRSGGFRYNPGDCIRSSADLIKLHPNKFRLAPEGATDTYWPTDVPKACGEGARCCVEFMGSGQYRVVNEEGAVEASGLSFERACKRCRKANGSPKAAQ